MKIMKLLFLGIFILMSSALIAAEKDTISLGEIEYQYPAKLDTLIQNFIAGNKENQLYQGYRIQLIASPNRQGVLKFKSDFYKDFPDKRPVLVYQQPNFKLRIGAFRTKIEAFREIKLINEKFPDAFIIQDEIPFEDL